MPLDTTKIRETYPGDYLIEQLCEYVDGLASITAAIERVGSPPQAYRVTDVSLERRHESWHLVIEEVRLTLMRHEPWGEMLTAKKK